MVSTSYFYRLFSHSPVPGLQRHMAKVSACASELVPLIEAALADDWPQVEVVRDRIAKLEDEADDLKKDLRMHLPKGVLLPMSRRDVLEVLMMQDGIANTTKDIAGLMLGRRMTLPQEIGPDYVAFARRCIDAVKQARAAVDELDELVETGFHGQEVEIVEGMLERLDAIEKETDGMQVELRAKLFVKEKELPPVDVIFIYQIIEWTGDVADLAQRVGSRLQLMLAR